MTFTHIQDDAAAQVSGYTQFSLVNDRIDERK